MTFFEFEEKDIISVVYTAYPSRSISMRGVSDSSTYLTASIYPYGPTGIGVQRTYHDINGAPLTQSFDIKSTIEINLAQSEISGVTKAALFRLRNIYASSSFYKPINYTSSSVATSITGTYAYIAIPSWYIGSGIQPGSFSINLAEIDGGAQYMHDDGYGGIYGNIAPNSGVLIGCIFYEYGIICLGPTINEGVLGDYTSVILNFSATNHVPMNVYLCEAPRSMLNFSRNPSYTQLSGTREEITMSDPQTFITTVGLYDKNYELVAVAKIATPILNQEADGAQFRLKLNF